MLENLSLSQIQELLNAISPGDSVSEISSQLGYFSLKSKENATTLLYAPVTKNCVVAGMDRLRREEKYLIKGVK